MPKEVKAKGERKKRAKKGTMPIDYVLLICSDPNAPKRGLSAYMFFAQVHIPLLTLLTRTGEPRFRQK